MMFFCLYSISDEIITVDLEEEEAFARPPQAGQNFDQIIESPLNELLQIGIRGINISPPIESESIY